MPSEIICRNEFAPWTVYERAVELCIFRKEGDIPSLLWLLAKIKGPTLSFNKEEVLLLGRCLTFHREQLKKLRRNDDVSVLIGESVLELLIQDVERAGEHLERDFYRILGDGFQPDDDDLRYPIDPCIEGRLAEWEMLKCMMGE